MKKILLLSAAAALACAACSKESVPEASTQSDGIKVTMTATAESAADTKVSLSGTTFSWEVGDEISLRWGGVTYNSSETASDYSTTTAANETLTAASAGASASFEGTFNGYVSGKILYAYYASDGAYSSNEAAPFYKDIPASQTGQISDIKDNVLFYAKIPSSSIMQDKDNDGNITGLTFSATMSPMFAVVKLTVPEALGATSIKMGGDSYLAGRVTVHPARSLGTPGNSSILYGRPSGLQYTDVTVSNGGAVLNGDIYFVVAPDAYDSEKGQYCCSTSSLTFTFTTAGGDIVFTRPLDSKIYNGTLKDLGSVPSTLKSTVEGGTIRLLDGKELAIGIENANEDCTYYIEYGTSESDCAKPTTSSDEIDLTNGWTIPNTGTYLHYFVKVLAHSNDSNYSDAYLKAYVQAYNFSNATTSGTTFKSVADDTDNYGAAGTGVTTDEGLYIGCVHALTGTQTRTAVVLYDSFVTSSNNYVAPLVVPQYGGTAYLYFRTSNAYSYSGTSVGFRLLNSKSSNNGNTSYTASMTRAASNEEAENKYFVWSIGTVSAGDYYGIRNDSKYPLYTLALLEVL